MEIVRGGSVEFGDQEVAISMVLLVILYQGCCLEYVLAERLGVITLTMETN